jgi:hypothetical protein
MPVTHSRPVVVVNPVSVRLSYWGLVPPRLLTETAVASFISNQESSHFILLNWLNDKQDLRGPTEPRMI